MGLTVKTINNIEKGLKAAKTPSEACKNFKIALEKRKIYETMKGNDWDRYVPSTPKPSCLDVHDILAEVVVNIKHTLSKKPLTSKEAEIRADKLWQEAQNKMYTRKS